MITSCLFLEEFSFISWSAPVVVLYWLFFKLLYSYLLSAMLDPVFTLLSLQHMFCIYFYLMHMFFFWLSCVEHPIFSDMFHIHPSVDKYWINEVYMCVCMSMCMCIVLSSRERQYSVFWDVRILSTFFNNLYF